jgi:hypothetical protein
MRPDSEKRLAIAGALVANRIDDVLRLRVLLAAFERDALEDAANRARGLLITVEGQLRLNIQ